MAYVCCAFQLFCGVLQLEKTDASGMKSGVKVIPFADMLKKGHDAKFDPHPPTSQDIAIIM